MKAFAEAIRVLPAHMSSRFSEVDANEPQLQLVFRHDCLCAPSTLLQLSCCVCCVCCAPMALVPNGAWQLCLWRGAPWEAGGRPWSPLLAALVQCAWSAQCPPITMLRLYSSDD